MKLGESNMNVKLGVSNMNVSNNGYDCHFTLLLLLSCFHTLKIFSSKITTKNLYPSKFR